MEVQPPAAPHFGGVWERFGRSCKKAMYAVLGNRSVTEDVLPTTMCIVEQTLNARPLTPVSSDVNDLEALTFAGTTQERLQECSQERLQERLLTISTMRRRICGSSKTLSTNSSLCKSHMGQVS